MTIRSIRTGMAAFLTALSLTCVLAVVQAGAAPAPGRLTPRFGDGGIVARHVVTEPTPGRVFGAINGPRGTALVLQPGKAGVAVARYLPDGRLDRSFGRNGIALDPRSNFYLEGHLASGPGGTIVASSSEAITRFTADGKIDRSYANGGEILRDRSGTDIGLATNLVLRNGATIVVSPSFATDTPLGIFATRYRPNGRIDRRYGKDGRAFAPVWNDYEPAAAVAMQGSRLLVLSPGEEDGELFLTRLTPDGRVDRSFGSDGLAAARRIKGRPVDMVQQPDGAIVVATSGNQLIRFGPKGDHDRSFGTHGVVVGPAPQTTLHSLIQAPDGDLIAAGAATEDGGPRGPTALAVERLTSSGSADPTFGSGTGYVARSLGPELRAGLRAAVVLPRGRLFLAGQVAHFRRGPFGAKIVLAGLEPDGTPTADFGDEGVVVTDAASPIAARSAAIGPLPPDTTVTFGPEGWTNVTRPVFGYESDNPEAWFECRLDAGPFEPCGPATYEVLEGHRGAKLSEGTHTIEVRAVGPDGEVDPTPAQAVFMVDTQPPTAAIISGPTGFTHQQRPTFTLQVAGADSFRCRIIGKNLRVTVPSCDGPTSFTPPRPLPEGTYELVVIARDLAANETEDRVEFSVRTKPGPPPPPPDPYRGSILYTGHGKGVKKVEFRLKGHKLIEASISVNLACSGGGRRHRFLYEMDHSSPRWPIAVNKRGGFRENVEEIRAANDRFERLAGQVTPQVIVGSIAVSVTEPARVGNETCHTGRLRPGRMEELSFRARRHPSRP